MKKIRFLIELRKKDVLEFVEPSEEIMKSYFEKARSNLESALILLNAGKFSESLSLSYYSMYSFILYFLNTNNLSIFVFRLTYRSLYLIQK